MRGEIIIELGWPDKVLSPNSRAHFMAVARAKKLAREEAFWACKVVKPLDWKHDGSRLPLVFTAHPPDARSRDDDNCAASLKAHRDGIAQALGIDDKLFDQRFRWGDPVKGGRVIAEIAA